MQQCSPGQIKPAYHWHAVSLTELLAANHLHPAPHLGSAGKECSDIPEGKNDQEMV